MNRIISRDGTWHNRNGVSGSNAGIKVWTPADSTTSLWYDASDASTVTIDTGVSQWNDKSAGGNNATQATGGNQPLYVTNDLAGRNVLEFTSARSLTHAYANATTNISIFMVVNVTTDTSSTRRRIFSTQGANTTQSNIYSRDTNTFNWGTLGSSSTYRFAGTAITADSWNIIGLTRTTGGIFYWNGSSSNSFATDSTGDTNGTIGGGFTGKLAELIVYNSSLSTSDRQRVEGYLAWKWNLVNRLSTSHPNYLFPPAV